MFISQCVVDHEINFTNVYTGWPGCVHDARVPRNSALYREAEAGNLILRDHNIFCDSAYPLRNWLVTPFKSLVIWLPSKVDLTRGSLVLAGLSRELLDIWKGVFAGYKMFPFMTSWKSAKMILFACILHNFCIINSD